MTRMDRQGLERKLEQTRRLALEPTDPLTRERLAQTIEELELQLQEKSPDNRLRGKPITTITQGSSEPSRD
jgi:hypothetical protein